MAKKMTEAQLAKLRDDLLRLYELYHDRLAPHEEAAISTTRDFIFEMMDEG